MSRRSRLTAAIWHERPKSQTREIARRLRQIQRGALRGAYVDPAAVYAAQGMPAPTWHTGFTDKSVHGPMNAKESV